MTRMLKWCKMRLLGNSRLNRAGMSLLTGSAAVFLVNSCSDNPPTPMAESLSAPQLYMTGIKYKQRGRIELSRQQFEKAIALDGQEGVLASKCRVFIATQLPVAKVSTEAEQRNAIGFNQLAHDEVAAATKTFQDLIADYPDFEWPYLSLAIIYLRQDKLADASALVEQAVKLNPNYLKAWAVLAQIREKQQDKQGGFQCRQRCQRLEKGELEQSGF